MKKITSIVAALVIWMTATTYAEEVKILSAQQNAPVSQQQDETVVAKEDEANQQIRTAATGLQEACQSENYFKKAGAQFARGISNAATCWIEILRSLVVQSRDNDPFVGVFVGLSEGAAYTILRAGGGVIDVASFAVPNYNNELYYNAEEPLLFCEENKDEG